MTDLSRDDPSRDSASSSKEGHIWRDVGVSAEAPARRPANGRMPRGRGFPGCGSLRTQEHARTGPRCMIRTEMWSFSCTQVLFIGVSQAHRAVDQRLRAPRQRTSPATTADQQPRQLPGLVETTHQPPRPANEADAGRLGPAPTPRSRCGRRSTTCGTCPRDRRACTCERRRNRAAPG